MSYKGDVLIDYPTFCLEGLEVPVRQDLVFESDDGKSKIVKKGQRVLIQKTDGDMVEAVHQGIVADVPSKTENGEAVFGYSDDVQTEASKISRGKARRVRKLILAAQLNDANKAIYLLDRRAKWWQLLRKSTNANGKDPMGQTAFHHACAYSSFEAIEALMQDARVDVAAQDFFGRTALHLLCMQTSDMDRRCDIIEYLLSIEVDALSVDVLRKTAADYALAHGKKYSRHLINALTGGFSTLGEFSEEDDLEINRMTSSQEVTREKKERIKREEEHTEKLKTEKKEKKPSQEMTREKKKRIKWDEESTEGLKTEKKEEKNRQNRH